MIYLATPYSHPSKKIRHWRYEQAQALWWHFVLKGYAVYSPIVHTHPAAVKYKAPQGYEFFQQLDEQMISAAEEVWVCHIPGWLNSKGMKAEIAFAEAQGIKTRNIIDAPLILEQYGLLQYSD